MISEPVGSFGESIFKDINDTRDLIKNKRRNLNKKFKKMLAVVDNGGIPPHVKKNNPKHEKSLRRNIDGRISNP